jgi:hypothetical protein
MAVEFPSEDRSSIASTLVDSSDQHDENDLSQSSKHRHLSTVPRLQLFVVLLIQISEPITATVIYPFVNQFVRATGVTKGDERKTGYYAGLIVRISFLFAYQSPNAALTGISVLSSRSPHRVSVGLAERPGRAKTCLTPCTVGTRILHAGIRSVKSFPVPCNVQIHARRVQRQHR